LCNTLTSFSVCRYILSHLVSNNGYFHSADISIIMLPFFLAVKWSSYQWAQVQEIFWGYFSVRNVKTTFQIQYVHLMWCFLLVCCVFEFVDLLNCLNISNITQLQYYLGQTKMYIFPVKFLIPSDRDDA
jgi:hypothetical protein